MTDLRQYGFNQGFKAGLNQFEDSGLKPARVMEEQKHLYKIICEYGVLSAEVSGKFRFNAGGTGDFPAVGDWVAAELRPDEGSATIHSVLPRISKFSRKAAGSRTDEQIVAANFDYVFIISSLNLDLNLRRLERYLTTAWESGGIPVITLTKADLCEDMEGALNRVTDSAPGVTVHAVSAKTGLGIETLEQYTQPGKTIVFMGSSGVGKSTLLNSLAGSEIMYVNDIREDDSKGRHTTTHRQMVLMPSGCMIIDTPGMRELSVWDGEDGISTAFNDIDELALLCKFSDCSHRGEPGCAVAKAIIEGKIPKARLESYRKLQKEIRFMEGKIKAAQVKKEHDKRITTSQRAFYENE